MNKTLVMTLPEYTTRPPNYKRISFGHETPKEYILFINFQLQAVSFDLQKPLTVSECCSWSTRGSLCPAIYPLPQAEFWTSASLSAILMLLDLSWQLKARITTTSSVFLRSTWSITLGGRYPPVTVITETYTSAELPRYLGKKILSCLNGKYIVFATVIKCDCYTTELEIDAHHQCLMFDKFRLKEKS